MLKNSVMHVSPRKFTQNISLGQWVTNQRRGYKKYQEGHSSCRITKKRIQLLNSIGFEWKVHDDQWDRRYKELVSYVKEFGDTCVPGKFPQNTSLRPWVMNQKRNRFHSTLFVEKSLNIYITKQVIDHNSHLYLVELTIVVDEFLLFVSLT